MDTETEVAGHGYASPGRYAQPTRVSRNEVYLKNRILSRRFRIICHI